ncbi:MAG: HAMP domain-containing sensor histidine kinase [Candidatus Woesearchaeota archaeon]
MAEPNIFISMIDIFLGLSVQVFHKVSWFLGTTNGELIKNLIEFIVYTIISYMLISEYKKSLKRELRYLILAFLSIMVGRLIMTIAFTYLVFTNITAPNVDVFLPIIDNTLEIIALLLIANAFIYPLFRKKQKIFKTNMSLQLISLLIIAVLLQLYWLSLHKYIEFKESLIYPVFEILKLILFSLPIITINRNSDINGDNNRDSNRKIIGKYSGSISFAFFLYLIAPILNLINFLFYNSGNEIFTVIAHPFPILSMLFFTRVVFLKLVDKATLKERLSKTQKMYEQQKELANLKDEFVSTVSHELRTPLTNIKLYLSLLMEGQYGKLHNKQKEPLKVIYDESNRLNNLINDILSLAKLEAKKQRFSPKETNIHNLVDSTVYYEMAKKKGVKIIIKIPKTMKVNIDENLFKQVIINLFSNALKFTDKGGKIILGAEADNEGFEFSIEDTGEGIEKEKLSYLFDKFYQAEHFMTREKSGTGLGLAIVKKIVELHKGTIDVESELGKGTMFRVFIPDIK